MKSKGLPYEIVVVDDGSFDQTFSRASAYAEQNGHVKVVSYVPNRGKGYAIKTGFIHAKGEIVVFVDGDLEIDLTTISRYIEALRYSDMVISSKWHIDSKVEMPLSRKFLSHGFNALVRILTGIPLKDTQSGLKGVKRCSFEQIFPKLTVKRYAFDVELLAVAHLYGLKIMELPIKINMTASFKLTEIWKMFIDLVGISYRLRVIHWYQ
jgi:glycosyltransferase involved in cell wall biosynthesis